jgi:hypothetical protein
LRLFSLAILLSPLEDPKLNGKNENKQCFVTGFFGHGQGGSFKVKWMRFLDMFFVMHPMGQVCA